MSIESEILRIQHNVADTYAAVADKGGSVPLQPNSENLPAAVASIPEGAGGGTLLNSLNRQLAVTQSQWELVDGVYQCTVPCDGVIANEAVQNIYSTPASAQQSACEECGVKCIEQKENALVYQAGSLPPDLLMYVTIVNASEMTSDLVAWSPKMTSNTTPAPYSVSGSNATDDRLYMAFDNVNTSTNYAVFKHSVESNITIDFGTSTTIYGIEISYPVANVAPKEFKLLGSADGDSFTLIHTIQTSNTEIALTYIPIKFAPVSYRYYQIWMNTTSYNVADARPCITDIRFLRPASDVEEAI